MTVANGMFVDTGDGSSVENCKQSCSDKDNCTNIAFSGSDCFLYNGGNPIAAAGSTIFAQTRTVVQSECQESVNIGQWRAALMFSLICTRINGWVNNGEAGDLRRHRPHYDVIVMIFIINLRWSSDSLRFMMRIHIRVRRRLVLVNRDFLVKNWFTVLWKNFIMISETMMTSSNGNIFHVTDLLWRECTSHQWIPLTKVCDAELWCFLWSAPDQTAE